MDGITLKPFDLRKVEKSVDLEIMFGKLCDIFFKLKYSLTCLHSTTLESFQYCEHLQNKLENIVLDIVS